MIPSSVAVVAMVLLLGASALALFVWAWRRGQFDHLDEQSRAVFDARDPRIERPWESEAQRRERERAHGPPLPAQPGEWGGAA